MTHDSGFSRDAEQRMRARIKRRMSAPDEVYRQKTHVGDFPADGTQFAQIGIVFAGVVALIAGGEAIIPAATPVIIKIRLYSIWLRINPRVMPKEIALAGLPDQVINLCSHLR